MGGVVGDIHLVSVGARVVIHCSAGIHRTGMFGYARPRACGLDVGAATEALARLRAVTAEGVGQQRLAGAEELAATTRRELSDVG